jgi:hypothetical protein
VPPDLFLSYTTIYTSTYSSFLINLGEYNEANGEGGVAIRGKGGGGRRDTWEKEVRPGWHVERGVQISLFQA